MIDTRLLSKEDLSIIPTPPIASPIQRRVMLMLEAQRVDNLPNSVNQQRVEKRLAIKLSTKPIPLCLFNVTQPRAADAINYC